MKFSQENKDDQYTMVYIIMHDGYSMISGNYYCDISYFNTGKWCKCDDNTVDKLIGLLDNPYRD